MILTTHTHEKTICTHENDTKSIVIVINKVNQSYVYFLRKCNDYDNKNITYMCTTTYNGKPQ